MIKRPQQNQSLRVTNIGHLVTMDAASTVLQDAWATIENGNLQAMGTGPAPDDWSGETLDAKGGIVLPGLINLHHHMYQNLARAYHPVADLPLLPWVSKMNLLWEKLTPQDLALATRVALVELMLSGCTTALDHHYVFPNGISGMIEAQFEVAESLGVRFVAGRGSIDLDSDIMVDWALEKTDHILADCERLIRRYHDTAHGSYNQMALAPTGPLICSERLLRETALLGQKYGVIITTHNCESADEMPWAMETVGRTPYDQLLKNGWTGDNVLLAHSIQMDDRMVAAAGQHQHGIAHCPCSNMRLGSGICRVQDLRRAGAKVGLGVDGSASNDSGHLLGEARLAMYLSRVQYGAASMGINDALQLATIEGARCLGRSHDLGSLEIGKCGDLAIFPEVDIFSSGASDPVDGLLLCHSRSVRHLVVGGKVVVQDGCIPGLDTEKLIEQHQACAKKFIN